MPTEIVLPKLGLTMEEAKVITWLKDIGDYVEENEVVLEVETDKANLEVEAKASGYLNVMKVGEGDIVKVGEVLGLLSANKDDVIEQVEETLTDEKRIAKKPEPKLQKQGTGNPFLKGERIRVSPAARKLARQEGIELENVIGTGPRGRIVLADVKDAIAQDKLVTKKPVVAVNIEGNDKVVQLTTMRKVIAEKMTDSFQNVPQFNLIREVDCTNVNDTRNILNEFNQSDIKLSLNDFIVQAVSIALQRHRSINAYFVTDEKGDYIVEKESINIGLAVAVESGLVVPVIHGVEKMGLGEIARKRAELVEKAQKGMLTPDEMSGGTFTISNLGGFNIEQFTAIVNPPESGILAVGRAKNTPVVNEEMEVVIKPILKLSASFDHRTIDGAQGAQFLQTIVNQLESTKWSLI